MKFDRRILLFIPIVAVYACGMFIDVMEVDAAQYASMSQEMLHTGNYLQLFDRGKDYLDKPPLLFWVSALSFRTFGISNFSYRLPSVLFGLLGIWATFGLGRALYNKTVGWYAALCLASCQAWFLMNHDVRTDTILSACTIFGLWQLFLFIRDNRLIHLVAGAVGVAGAMLTKGPIGLMIPGIALLFYLVSTKAWNKIFTWQWLLGGVVVALCLSPMLWGLYQQYDLHPGKVINGQAIGSGLRFYFWTQSFGRITGENVWKDDTTPLFFTHTFLWAFLPWCLLFVTAFWKTTMATIKSGFFHPPTELLTWGGFVVPFIMVSLSHYKLPHYIFPILPLGAIMTGHYLDGVIGDGVLSKTGRVWRGVQLFAALVVLALLFLLAGLCFPASPGLFWPLFLAALGLVIYLAWFGRNSFQQVVMPALVAITVFNFFMNTHVYPAIFSYASAPAAARMIREMPGDQTLVGYRSQPFYGLDFYSRRVVPFYDAVDDLRSAHAHQTVWVYADPAGYADLKAAGLSIVEKRELDEFHVSSLSILFVNPITRARELHKNYLLKINLN